MSTLHKYPRTHHIEGSGLQPGDEVLHQYPLGVLAHKQLVIEEKMDGANAAISFAADGRLQLQSRGHFLAGGPREQQFALFKTWANRYAAELWNVLGNRYVLYGEWLYAKHTLFYTDLPHYFMEFDMLDTADGTFLSTERRADLLRHAPFIVPVAVLHAGTVASLQSLQRLIEPSRFVAADHRDQLRAAAVERGLDPDHVLHQTDASGLMEGLYIKVEHDGVVQARYKYVRSTFLQTVINSDSHWMDRPLVPNNLRAGVSLFS